MHHLAGWPLRPGPAARTGRRSSAKRRNFSAREAGSRTMWRYGGAAICANPRRPNPRRANRWSCWRPPSWAAHGSSIIWRSERGCGAYHSGSDNADGLGFRIEHDLRLAAFELADDVRHLVLQRELFFSVVRSLAQYIGLDHGVQQIRRQLGQRNNYRMRNLVLHVQSSLRAHARYG